MLALRRRNVVIGLALLAAALGAFVLVYFEPQKLFIDDEVHEAPPVLSAPTTAAAPKAPATRTLSTGAFRSFEHASSGRARVLALADGRRYVRFEDFGPPTARRSRSTSPRRQPPAPATPSTIAT
jgi:hypothetical protein